MARPAPILGPFKLGQTPLITATLTPIGGGVGVSDACEWTVRSPAADVEDTTYTEASPEVQPDGDNVWTLLLPPIEHDGIYWIRLRSTSGLIAASEIRMAVEESAFDTDE